MPQEFLASFAVDIDESGVNRLQLVLQQNRDLAREVSAAFDQAKSSMDKFLGELSDDYLSKISIPVCVKVTIKAPDIAYSVVNGADHTVGDGQDAVITVERNYEDQKTYGLYTGADMDGTALPAGSYSTAQGSLILTLKAAYLDTLEVGSHQLTISFRDGKATATLHIRAGEATPTPTPAEPTETPKPVPKTGDDGNPVLWIGLVLLGLIGIGGMAVTKRKSRT